MDRRTFTKFALGLSALYLQRFTVGCRPISTYKSLENSVTGDDIIEIPDLIVRSLYSTGEFGPNTGFLKADYLITGKEVTQKHWDEHGHKYTFTKADYLKILNKEDVKVQTTIAQNHDHFVIASLKYPDPNGTITPVPRSKIPGLMPDSKPNNLPGNLKDKEIFHIALDEEDYLYIHAKGGLTPEQVSYCLDELAKCQNDSSIWTSLTNLSGEQAQFFKSSIKLNLDPNAGSHDLLIRAVQGGDTKTITQIMKLLSTAS